MGFLMSTPESYFLKEDPSVTLTISLPLLPLNIDLIRLVLWKGSLHMGTQAPLHTVVLQTT